MRYGKIGNYYNDFPCIHLHILNVVWCVGIWCCRILCEGVSEASYRTSENRRMFLFFQHHLQLFCMTIWTEHVPFSGVWCWFKNV